MSLERLTALHERILAAASAPTDSAPERALDARLGIDLLESQLLARHLDMAALRLRARGEGFYTICSAGHEGNVVLGRVTRPSDPALLHYRSAALFLERARARPAFDAVEAVALGLTASADDPVSGGRHKVFGSLALGVLPQTSTIGSHVPKAVGVALSIDRAHRIGASPVLAGMAIPEDALVLCSVGDASLNHASTTVALNAAGWVASQGLPLPLLLVCEDNGLGISVRSPAGWSEAALRRPGFTYFGANGWELAEALDAAERAVAHCRTARAPAVLHLRCTRLLGHSGADPDTVYRSADELSRSAALDPIAASARALIGSGALDADALRALDAAADARVQAAERDATRRPKLRSRAQVMEALPATQAEAVASEAQRTDFEHTAGPMPPMPLMPMGRAINRGLHEMMDKYPQALLFGQDVADKGGIYNITAGLWKRLGPARVFNTLLDETTILALAQGAAALGLLPVPEVQYLAFLHNAEDQLRGEAATTAFFSRGQLTAPMVLRIGSYGYQKGFGGHFHNDNSIAVLRDIPGLLLATPGRASDAVRMLRTCFAAARIEGRVVVFLEPIALYNRRDLAHDADGFYLDAYPERGDAIAVGEVGCYGPLDADAGATPALTIASYGNGLRIALQAQRALSREHGLACRVVDLRWLSPLPTAAVLAHALPTGRLLVVDECRRAGNVGEGLVAELACHPGGRELSMSLVTAAASPVPLGDAAELVLVSLDEVTEAARELASRALR